MHLVKCEMDCCNNYPSYRHLPGESGSYLHSYHHPPHHPFYSSAASAAAASAMRYQGHSGAFRGYGYPSYYDHPYPPYHHSQNHYPHHYQSPVANSYANLREGFGGSYNTLNHHHGSHYSSSGGGGGGNYQHHPHSNSPGYYNHQPSYSYESYRSSSGFQYQSPYRDFYNTEASLYSNKLDVAAAAKEAPTYIPPSASPFTPIHGSASGTPSNGTPKSAYSEPSDDAVSHHSGSSSAYCDYPASPATPFREQHMNTTATALSSNESGTNSATTTAGGTNNKQQQQQQPSEQPGGSETSENTGVEQNSTENQAATSPTNTLTTNLETPTTAQTNATDSCASPVGKESRPRKSSQRDSDKHAPSRKRYSTNFMPHHDPYDYPNYSPNDAKVPNNNFSPSWQGAQSTHSNGLYQVDGRSSRKGLPLSDLDMLRSSFEHGMYAKRNDGYYDQRYRSNEGESFTRKRRRRVKENLKPEKMTPKPPPPPPQNLTPLPGFQEAFGSTEIGRFSDVFFNFPESPIEPMIESDIDTLSPHPWETGDSLEGPHFNLQVGATFQSVHDMDGVYEHTDESPPIDSYFSEISYNGEY